MSPVVIAVIVITLLGLAFGLILSVAGKKLAVEVDPRIEQILALLPGANCGGCGHGQKLPVRTQVPPEPYSSVALVLKKPAPQP